MVGEWGFVLVGGWVCCFHSKVWEGLFGPPEGHCNNRNRKCAQNNRSSLPCPPNADCVLDYFL